DFGLAAFADTLGQPLDISARETAVERLTSQGTAMGTLHYMSPEQSSGRAITPASDVFSLGAVLYEPAAGLPPVRGMPPLPVMHAMLCDQHAPLPPRVRDVPPALEQVVRRALRKDPSQRQQDGAALREDLMRVSAEAGWETPGPARRDTGHVTAPTT